MLLLFVFEIALLNVICLEFEIVTLRRSGNFEALGTLKLQDFRTLELWNFGTSKRRNQENIVVHANTSCCNIS